jgi:hypothetical protein
LGLRGIFDAQQLPSPPAAAGSSSSRKQQAAGMSVVSEQHFQRWRYMLGIAEGDTDIPTGALMCFAMALSVSSGVDATLSCIL